MPHAMPAFLTIQEIDDTMIPFNSLKTGGKSRTTILTGSSIPSVKSLSRRALSSSTTCRYPGLKYGVP